MQEISKIARHVLRASPALTDLLSRMGADLTRLAHPGVARAVIRASGQCRTCAAAAQCQAWRAATEEGQRARPPAFCSSAHALKVALTPPEGLSA